MQREISKNKWDRNKELTICIASVKSLLEKQNVAMWWFIPQADEITSEEVSVNKPDCIFHFALFYLLPKGNIPSD